MGSTTAKAQQLRLLLLLTRTTTTVELVSWFGFVADLTFSCDTVAVVDW